MALMWSPYRLATGISVTASGFILGVFGVGEIGEGNVLGWPVTVGTYVLALAGFGIGWDALST